MSLQPPFVFGRFLQFVVGMNAFAVGAVAVMFLLGIGSPEEQLTTLSLLGLSLLGLIGLAMWSRKNAQEGDVSVRVDDEAPPRD